jgi:hypothetical protein
MESTPEMKAYKDKMDKLFLSVEKYAWRIVCATVFVLLDIRFLYMASEGGVTGMQDRVGSRVFTLEHMWQEFVHKWHYAMVNFLMGTMCMNMQTVLSGICYTTAFTSPMSKLCNVWQLSVSCVVHAILHWRGYYQCDVFFAIFFAAVYNTKTWTVGKVVFSTCLQAILCNDILIECQVVLRYIVLYFFVCRVFEIIPIALHMWHVGICLKQLVVQTYGNIVRLVLSCRRCVYWTKSDTGGV